MADFSTLLMYWPTWILVTSYGFLFILEKNYPLRKIFHPGLQRFTTNITMTIIVIFVAQRTVLPTVKAAMNISERHGIGLFHLFDLKGWYAFVWGFLLLDLSFYYWHRLNHKTALFWRFHNVHHIDKDLDVTTAMRFHWGEIAYSSIFRFIQIIILGVTPNTLLVYEFVFQLCTFFHHSNINLPKRFETILGYLIITPRLHGIHHSNYRQETDSNYGVVFSIWDKLHRSFKRSIQQKDITIGVPAYAKEEDNQLKALLILPFRKQRNYWTTLENQSHEQRNP